MVPLKHLSNYWRTIEMTLINCVTQPATFSITDANLNVPVVNLLTQDNAKLLE